MLRIADTNKPCLHLVYEMWDSMIEKVKAVIYRHEGLEDDQYSSLCASWFNMYSVQVVPASGTPDGWMGLDIGPDSIKTFNESLDTT